MHSRIIENLTKRLESELPGAVSQQKMMPSVRPPMPGNEDGRLLPKDSAVLILLYFKKDKLYTVFTQRHEYKGVHSGQISFPGGRKEENDLNLWQTAIRETEEEIGIKRNKIQPCGGLTPLFVPPSNFKIQPFTGVLKENPVFNPHPFEVKEIIEFPVFDLFEKDIIKSATIRTSSGFDVVAPYFDVKGHRVWGATAMILSEFLDILKDLA